MRILFIVKLAAAALAANLLLGLSAAAQPQSLYAAIKDNPRLETLAAAVERADLVSALSEEGPYTLFAPTDLAFMKIPDEEFFDLWDDDSRDQLRALILDHVVKGRYTATSLAGEKVTLETLGGRTLTVDASGTPLEVDGASVTRADLLASNGIIHVIDTLLR